MEGEISANEPQGLSKSTLLSSCKNRQEQKEFEAFERADVSLKTFFIFVMVSSTISIVFKTVVYDYSKTRLNLISIIIAVVCETLFGLSIILAQMNARHYKLTTQSLTKVLALFENLYVMAVSISAVMALITIVLNGHCEKHLIINYSDRISGCTYGDKNQMPEAVMALVLVYPMMLSMIVKSVKSETVFVAWLINFIVSLALIGKFNLRLSFGPFVCFALMTLLTLFEYQRQKISMFFLTQKLRGTQTENERLEKENRASELKHLIGNVAHDLKTVSFRSLFILLYLD
jgi:hypothetical protein